MKLGLVFSILLISGTLAVPLNVQVAEGHDILLYSDSQTNGSGDDNTPPTTRERCFVTVTVNVYTEHHGIHHRNNPDSTFYPGDAFRYETSVTKNGCVANSLEGCKLHSSNTLSAPKNNLGCSAGDSATWGSTSDGGTAVVIPTYAGGGIWIERQHYHVFCNNSSAQRT